MTLESQYKQFIQHNPDSKFSFNEWKQWHGNQIKQALTDKMKQFIASATVNGNEVKLVKEGQSYFIYWGLPLDTYQSKTELLTKAGKIPSQSLAYKEFLRAVKATSYVTFKKI